MKSAKDMGQHSISVSWDYDPNTGPVLWLRTHGRVKRSVYELQRGNPLTHELFLRCL